MAIPPLRSEKQVAANKAAAKKRAAATKARQKVAADKRALAKKRQPYKNFGLTKKTLEERYTPAEIKKLNEIKKLTGAKKSTGDFTAQPKAVEGKGTDLGKMRRDSAKMDANQKVTASANEQKTAAAKSATSVTRPPKQVKAPQDVPKKKTWKDYKSLREARAAGEDYYIKNGRKMAAVLASDLGEGQSLTDYMNSKKRGKVQKPPKQVKAPQDVPRKYRDGGSVRGVGKATKGIRACKMR